MFDITNDNFEFENIGLLDLSGTGKTFLSFFSGFYPVECADLFTILETLVIRDKVLLIGKTNTTPESALDLLKPFINEGVIILNETPTPIEQLPNPNTNIREATKAALRQELTRGTYKDANYEVSRIVGAEQSLRIPSTVLLRNLQHYGYSRKPQFEHRLCSLVNKYQEISDLAYLIKEKDFNHHYTPPAIKPIPPIALEVLQVCRNIYDLHSATLEIREKHQKLRSLYSRLNSMQYDRNISASKLASYIYSWNNDWDRLNDYTSKGCISIAETSSTLLKKANFVGKLLYSCVDPTTSAETLNAANELLQELRENQTNKIFRPLHKSVHNYIHTSPQMINMELSRVFEYDPKVIETKMRQLAFQEDNVWYQKLRGLGS